MIYITDYILNPDIERSILGDNLSESLTPEITVLLVWHELINREYIDSLPALKGIVRYGVGFDNIDLEYSKYRNIYVCNTPDYGVEEVCDTAITMIMNIARGVTRYDFKCRSYHKTWQENVIQELKRCSDLVLGVIGAGRIGGSILLKARSMRFKTLFYDPYKDRGHEKLLGSMRVDRLGDLLSASDIVSFNAPLTSETLKMVNEDFIRNMKQGASFINTARGKVVSDIDIFYEPLKTGHLSNVALDVLPHEPPEESKLINAWRNREEWLEGRFMVNPHAAYYSEQAYKEMRTKVATNALRIINNQRPFNIVNGL